MVNYISRKLKKRHQKLERWMRSGPICPCCSTQKFWVFTFEKPHHGYEYAVCCANEKNAQVESFNGRLPFYPDAVVALNKSTKGWMPPGPKGLENAAWFCPQSMLCPGVLKDDALA